MAEVLRVHLEEGALPGGQAFRDFPSEVGCTEGGQGLLFHTADGVPHAWFRGDLVRYVERVTIGPGVNLVTPWSADGHV